MKQESLPKLRRQLKIHEGTHLRGGLHVPYQDSVDVTTIGYGHNLYDHPINYGKGLTDSQAELLLTIDMERAIRDVMKAYPWAADLDDARLGVLIDMMFNLGPSRLAGFKNFLENLEWVTRCHATVIEPDAARLSAYEMLDSKWATQVPRRAIALVKIMLSGNWEYE